MPYTDLLAIGATDYVRCIQCGVAMEYIYAVWVNDEPHCERCADLREQEALDVGQDNEGWG